MSPLWGFRTIILALDNITPLGLRVAGLGMVQEKCHPLTYVTPSGLRGVILASSKKCHPFGV
jgi:hypothetical protein